MSVPNNGSDSTTFVRPYTTQLGQNIKLLSKLKPSIQSFPSTTFSLDDAIPSKVRIPILKNTSIESILDANNAKIAQGDNQTSSTQRNISAVGADAGTTQDDTLESNDDAMEIDSDPTLFIELKNFLPKNLKEQAATICIKHFPNVKRSLIEKIIDILLNQCTTSGKTAFRWTIINNEHIDDKLVYVTFSSIETLRWFINYASPILPKLWEGIEVIVDPAANEYINGKPEEDLDLTKESNDVAKILKSKRNFETVSKKTGTEDLDEVMQSYSSYKVDSADLVDIPKDMKEKTVSNIIKFRSKVLTIEKDRRKREIEYERRKAKNRLKQIFEGLKETTTTSKEDDISVKPEDDNEDDTDEFPEMSEADYEKYLVVKEQEVEENEYQTKLNELERLEQNEKAKLLEKLSTLNNYENNLIDNKFLYLEEIRNFQDFNFENTISSHEKTERFKLYYNDHSEYLRLRNKERTKEEELDKLNEEEDDEMVDPEDTKISTKPSSISVSAPKPTPSSESKPEPEPEPVPESPIKPAVETPTENKEIEETKDQILASVDDNDDIIISSLPKNKLELINDKISDLIEEYLGIKENVLIEFIYDFLITHDLKSKDELIFELEETLDEDSVVVTNELWNYINQIKNN